MRAGRLKGIALFWEVGLWFLAVPRRRATREIGQDRIRPGSSVVEANASTAGCVILKE